MNPGTANDVRWAEAEAILSGRDEPGAPPAGARRFRYRGSGLLVGMLVVVGLLVLYVLLAAHAISGDGPRPTSPSIPRWRDLPGLALVTIGLGLDGLGLVWLVRHGQFGRRWRRAASSLTMDQSNQARRQATGQAPRDPARLMIVRYLAQRITRQPPASLIFAGLAVMQIGNTLRKPDLEHLGSLALIVTAVVMQVIFTRRDARRAQLFLDQHPESP